MKGKAYIVRCKRAGEEDLRCSVVSALNVCEWSLSLIGSRAEIHNSHIWKTTKSKKKSKDRYKENEKEDKDNDL